MNRRGFTLVEVLLVIIIIGVLAGIVIPRIVYSKVEAQRQACNSNVGALNAQTELYQAKEGAWPSSLDDLLNADYIDRIPTCPFNQTYVWNSTSHRVIWHSH